MNKLCYDPHDKEGTVNQLRTTLAASLVVLTQAVCAADEIDITPAQRQISLTAAGIVTLSFEVENRSDATHELQESISLPTGWKLITNTAPFLLSKNSRNRRLIHISLPPGINAGDYQVGYQVFSRNNGAVASNESVTVTLEAKSGTELAQHQAPGSLLEGEAFIVDFIAKNTGNQVVSYTFAAQDSDDFIVDITPRKAVLEAGRSKIIRVSGRVSSKIHETRQYAVTLQALGGGSRVNQTINIPLIARTPKGAGKYHKLPGKLTTRYGTQKRTEADKNSRAYQLEYFARGHLDKAGEHNVKIRLRNGKRQNQTRFASQLENYYVAYWNDELEVKTGHQSFRTTPLIGNSLYGIGASARYRPKNESARSPLKVEGFYGRNRSGERNTERSVFAALSYNWGEYEVGASLLRTRKKEPDQDEKNTTIGSVKGTWRSENTVVSSEIAVDSEGNRAVSGQLNGRWENLGFNTSVTAAEPRFAGSISDTIKAYAGLHYALNERNSIDIDWRSSRKNIDNDSAYEIRADSEQRIRFTRAIGDAKQASVSVGYRQRREKDKRPAPVTDRTTKAITFEYQHRFDEFDIRIAAEKGISKDYIRSGDSNDGLRGEFSVNWHPNHDINFGANYVISQDLDSAGKTTSIGLNSRYRINSRSGIHGYVQDSKNEASGSHSRSYALQYNYDLKQYGEFGIQARKVDNVSGSGDQEDDYSVLFEYSLPLDVPFRKRRDVGTVKGVLRYPDKTPASDIVLKLGDQYAVTDSNGQFLYPDTIARDYQLHIDHSRPNAQNFLLDGIAELNKVKLRPDTTVKMDLTLQKGAHLEGKLATFVTDTAATLFDKGDNPAGLVEEKGIGMVLLELRPMGAVDNRITHRRSTLFDGSFSFMGIRPGKWELSVADSSRIPKQHRLEQRRFIVDLTAGSRETLLIRALPVRQSIKKTGPEEGFSISG